MSFRSHKKKIPFASSCLTSREVRKIGDDGFVHVFKEKSSLDNIDPVNFNLAMNIKAGVNLDEVNPKVLGSKIVHSSDEV